MKRNPEFEILNPNIEILNKFQILNPDVPNSFGFGSLEFRHCLGFSA